MKDDKFGRVDKFVLDYKYGRGDKFVSDDGCLGVIVKGGPNIYQFLSYFFDTKLNDMSSNSEAYMKLSNIGIFFSLAILLIINYV